MTDDTLKSQQFIILAVRDVGRGEESHVEGGGEIEKWGMNSYAH